MTAPEGLAAPAMRVGRGGWAFSEIGMFVAFFLSEKGSSTK
jgi:hypothetical protein